MLTTVQQQYQGLIACFSAIEKDELKEAFNDKLCELTPGQFSAIFQIPVRYVNNITAVMDVSVGGLLFQQARTSDSKKLLVDKIKEVGLSFDTMLCYYEVPQTLSHIAHDASPEYDALLGDVAAGGGGFAE